MLNRILKICDVVVSFPSLNYLFIYFCHSAHQELGSMNF